jgi:hypothetical protein
MWEIMIGLNIFDELDSLHVKRNHLVGYSNLVTIDERVGQEVTYSFSTRGSQALGGACMIIIKVDHKFILQL